MSRQDLWGCGVHRAHTQHTGDRGAKVKRRRGIRRQEEKRIATVVAALSLSCDSCIKSRIETFPLWQHLPAGARPADDEQAANMHNRTRGRSGTSRRREGLPTASIHPRVPRVSSLFSFLSPYKSLLRHRLLRDESRADSIVRKREPSRTSGAEEELVCAGLFPPFSIHSPTPYSCIQTSSSVYIVSLKNRQTSDQNVWGSRWPAASPLPAPLSPYPWHVSTPFCTHLLPAVPPSNESPSSATARNRPPLLPPGKVSAARFFPKPRPRTGTLFAALFLRRQQAGECRVVF